MKCCDCLEILIYPEGFVFFCYCLFVVFHLVTVLQGGLHHCHLHAFFFFFGGENEHQCTKQCIRVWTNKVLLKKTTHTQTLTYVGTLAESDALLLLMMLLFLGLTNVRMFVFFPLWHFEKSLKRCTDWGVHYISCLARCNVNERPQPPGVYRKAMIRRECVWRLESKWAH